MGDQFFLKKIFRINCNFIKKNAFRFKVDGVVQLQCTRSALKINLVENFHN